MWRCSGIHPTSSASGGTWRWVERGGGWGPRAGGGGGGAGARRGGWCPCPALPWLSGYLHFQSSPSDCSSLTSPPALARASPMQLRQSTLSTPSSSPAQSASDADSPSLSPHSGGGTPTTHFAAGATSSSSTTATSTSDGIGTGGSSRRRSAATLAARTSAAPTRPAVRVVSFHADVTNRGPAFDMDLSELLQPVGAAGAGAAGAGLAEAGAAAAANGAAAAADRAQRGEGQQGWQPVSYQQAREYFRRDVALR